MDHKWGWNVVEYGVGSYGATLAARILTGPYAGWIITNGAVRDSEFATWLLPDVAHDAYYRFDRVKAFFGHFPYGANVEPDGPL